MAVPLADYEGHMAQVGQAQLLADVFGHVLKAYSPRSIGVIGCAGGNGFEKIDPKVTPRVVGIDINPDYIAQTRIRFSGRIPALELHVGDVQTGKPVVLPVDVVFAALVFEYVDVAAALTTIRSMLKPGGMLVSVVQLPSAATGVVTPSPFSSVQGLAQRMRLVSPEELEELAVAGGFESGESRVIESPGGKQFHVHSFKEHHGNSP
jgi:SAM-dependent methyltransferase